MLQPFSITWQPRAVPLAPGGVAARGTAASKLARRLLQYDDVALAQLTGVAGTALLLVFGPAALLPWADGALYLGRLHTASAWWWPTNLAPDVPPLLLERALARQCEVSLPCAVLPHPPQLIPLGAARPIYRPSLVQWLEANP